MISFIIWVVGIVLGIKAILDIFKKNINTGWKIVWSALLIVTSWLGLAVYWFYAKDKLEDWCK